MEGKCTIYFDDPFWVGVFERIEDDTISAVRYVFGSEPTDVELYQFVLTQYARLEFGAPIAFDSTAAKSVNFKRAQRLARRQVAQTGIGTRAQRALQAEYERMKEVHQEDHRILRDEEAKQKFAIRQEKKKQRHRGH